MLINAWQTQGMGSSSQQLVGAYSALVTKYLECHPWEDSPPPPFGGTTLPRD